MNFALQFSQNKYIFWCISGTVLHSIMCFRSNDAHMRYAGIFILDKDLSLLYANSIQLT